MAKRIRPEASSLALTTYKPQPGPQLAAFEATWCYELLYGGARGGGKSIYLLLDFLQDVPTYGENWHGILVRKTFKQLEQLIADSRRIYGPTGAYFEKQPKTWHWPNGATLKFRNLETVDDTEDYQGHSYGWFGMDEAGGYPNPDVYFRLLACCRSGAAEIPTARTRLTANPGGRGHHWLKERFINPAPLGFTPIATEVKDGVRERMYIPSKVSDNKLLLNNDPHYIDNLKLQATPELVEAWLNGNWDVQLDSFFSEFSTQKHVMKPFEIPDGWTRFRSFDWGSAEPFCVHWWAVADGNPVVRADNSVVYLPRGCLICYREWYGQEPGRPNVGIRLRNEDIAAGIVARTGDERMSFTCTDSKPFHDNGGVTIAETFARNGVPVKIAKTKRVSGWQQVRSRLQGTSMGPLIVFFDSCVHAIRTLPALQPDKLNLEDTDDRMEDHAPDSIRYACMERPVARKRIASPDLKNLNEMTFNELLKWDEIHRED